MLLLMSTDHRRPLRSMDLWLRGVFAAGFFFKKKRNLTSEKRARPGDRLVSHQVVCMYV
jgi:hypothetical protein